MERQRVTKTEFQKLLKTIGDESFQVVSEGNVWYEQLTDDETVYVHKLLSIIELKSYDALNTKAKNSSKSVDVLPNVYVCVCDAVVYYYLVPVMKMQKVEAENAAFSFADLMARMKSARPPCVMRMVREVTRK